MKIALSQAMWIFLLSLGLWNFQPEVARADEGHHAIGIEAGEVQLTGNVASSYGGALGVGAFFNYAASNFMEVELEWLNSHHTSLNSSGQSLNQNVYGASLLWDLLELDIFTPYFRLGGEFVTHNQDVSDPATGISANYNSNAFGLVLGFGAKLDLAKNLTAGMDFTWHTMFDSSVTTPSGNAVKTVQSDFTALLKLGFAFGGE